jgi:hydroxyethylthiazole kinase-like uncharacterized protein yjeF
MVWNFFACSAMLVAMNELITPEDMYQADAIAIQHGRSIENLIEAAGRAVAEEILRRYGARRVVVLAGPGNKGRDGKAAAAFLQACGWPVRVSDDIGDAALIIDALFGAGLNRDFSSTLADKINGAGVPIVAIDVPSGIDGLTGQVRGAAVKADLTVTFFRKKPAHVLLPGKVHCGEVVLADIGIDESVLSDLAIRQWENTKPVLPRFDAAAYKFSKGHAVVVSGGALQTGASRLCASAALKIGAGLVTIVGRSGALKVQATHLTAVMLVEVMDVKSLANLLKDKRINAICIGPAASVGAKTVANVKAMLASGAACVLDADALTSFSAKPQNLFAMIAKDKSRPVVLTPHEGEFARLFPGISNPSKIERARQAAAESGAVVLLKGADTVVAHPDGRAVVNTNAPPALATAGSGDVLAGIITGLLAQGMDGFAAACAGAWLHGEAANVIGRKHLTAEDLVYVLGQVS